jgi:hypothetical protein
MLLSISCYVYEKIQIRRTSNHRQMLLFLLSTRLQNRFNSTPRPSTALYFMHNSPSFWFAKATNYEKPRSTTDNVFSLCLAIVAPTTAFLAVSYIFSSLVTNS